jgi:hypothetical protein
VLEARRLNEAFKAARDVNLAAQRSLITQHPAIHEGDSPTLVQIQAAAACAAEEAEASRQYVAYLDAASHRAVRSGKQ